MRPLAIAHRGYHQKYYENTINAFKEAAKEITTELRLIFI